MRGVYLLHFDPPYKHAAHYLGWAEDIAARVEQHRNGAGARLTQVAVSAGCALILARVWPDADRATERRYKNQHNSPRLCPICRQVNQSASAPAQANGPRGSAHR